ncbi:conserved phage C-terminal domain-containing protein [Intestinibacter sp.]|uniref:conserved phage C-terminal domain-containing protein n=1 Tax=Intestinibacter sp. TaxID=1965304 RepID=UPI002A766B10|nr:conserved phage C-terminal domain-containing protein [Intestinibacter sp.]MDY2737541.1 conserved phage C-terminal domain-containing protein [Intestinibacter sp.]
MRKWIHGYKQDVAIEYGLSNDELLILRHFEDFANSHKMDSFFDGKDMYYWVNYEKFLKDLPIINFKKERLGEIMVHDLSEKPDDLDKKMEVYSDKMKAKVMKRKYIGVLKSKIVKNALVGTRSYFAFTPKFYLLKPDITENDSEMMQDLDSVKIPNQDSVNLPNGSVKIPNQDSVKIPDGFGKNTGDRVGKNTAPKIDYNDRPLEIDNIYSRVIDKLNSLANKKYKYTTNKTKSLIDARLNEGFIEEDFYKVIDIKVKAWKGTDMDRFLRPETLFGNKFEGYLNESEAANNNKSNKKTQQTSSQSVVTKFHNYGNEHYKNYEADELEKKLLDMQKKKRGGLA